MDPTLYPITSKFESELKVILDNVSDDRRAVLLAVSQNMLANLQEYEHGVANPEDLLPVAVYKILNKAFQRVDDQGNAFSTAALEILSSIYIDLLNTIKFGSL